MKSSIFVGFAIFAVTGAALAAEHSGPSRVDSSPSTTSAQTRCLDVNGDVQAKSSSMTAFQYDRRLSGKNGPAGVPRRRFAEFGGSARRRQCAAASGFERTAMLTVSDLHL